MLLRIAEEDCSLFGSGVFWFVLFWFVLFVKKGSMVVDICNGHEQNSRFISTIVGTYPPHSIGCVFRVRIPYHFLVVFFFFFIGGRSSGTCHWTTSF